MRIYNYLMIFFKDYFYGIAALLGSSAKLLHIEKSLKWLIEKSPVDCWNVASVH